MPVEKWLDTNLYGVVKWRLQYCTDFTYMNRTMLSIYLHISLTGKFRSSKELFGADNVLGQNPQFFRVGFTTDRATELHILPVNRTPQFTGQ
jgi:hypothetical protein